MSRRATWFDRQPFAVGCVAWLFGYAVLVVSVMLWQGWLHRTLGQWIVHHLYPPAQYGEVRILDKHGRLSNGQFLYGWWYLLWGFGSYLGSVPLFFALCWVMYKLGMIDGGRERERA